MEEEVRARFEICSARKKPLVVGSTVFKSITDFELSEKEIEKAHLELGETDEVRKDGLQKLRRRLLENRNVRYRTDDLYLLRYLRVRKFNSDKAYNSLKKFYYFKKNYLEIFNIPSNLNSLLDMSMVTILPYSDKVGRIAFWADVGKWKPEEEPIENVMGTTTCIADVISMNPRCQVNGVIGIWDVKELNISHFSHIITRFPTIVSIILNGYPWRVKYIFIMNTGKFSQIIYNAVRPFLTKKVKERVFLLGSDFTKLHEHVDPEILPKVFGGNLEEENFNISKFILENLPYIEYERSFI